MCAGDASGQQNPEIICDEDDDRGVCDGNEENGRQKIAQDAEICTKRVIEIKCSTSFSIDDDS